MDKSEEIILEERINEKELTETKSYKKIKYSMAIIASTLIIAAVITLSIGHFKIEVIEEETKPVNRNLGEALKTYSLASFKVLDQTVSVKYEVKMSGSQFMNKIIIKSGLGSFEFGNTQMSTATLSSKTYNIKIFQFILPNQPDFLIVGYAKGTLSWDVGMKASGGYGVGLSGKLSLAVQVLPIKGKLPTFTVEAKGTLAEAKGRLIASDGIIMKDPSFSLGMGELSIIFRGSSFGKAYTLNLYEKWRSVK